MTHVLLFEMTFSVVIVHLKFNSQERMIWIATKAVMDSIDSTCTNFRIYLGRKRGARAVLGFEELYEYCYLVGLA